MSRKIVKGKVLKSKDTLYTVRAVSLIKLGMGKLVLPNFKPTQMWWVQKLKSNLKVVECVPARRD